MTAPTPERRVGEAEVFALISKAYDEVSRICDERWAGGHGWRTTIPARPGYDSDLIIGGALRTAKTHIVSLTAEVERLREAINWAMGCGPEDDFPDCFERHFAWRPGLSARAGMIYDAAKGQYVSLPTHAPEATE